MQSTRNIPHYNEDAPKQFKRLTALNALLEQVLKLEKDLKQMSTWQHNIIAELEVISQEQEEIKESIQLMDQMAQRTLLRQSYDPTECLSHTS